MRVAMISIIAAIVVGPAFAATYHNPPPLVIPNNPSQIPDGDAVQMHPVNICQPLDKFKALFDDKTKFSTATAAEFHIFEGMYLGNPKTPEGLPPGDGALIVTHAPNHGKQGIAVVTWTKNDGKEVCGGQNQILLLPAAILPMIGKIETGKDETLEPGTNDEGDVTL